MITREPLSKRQLLDAIGRMDERSQRAHAHDEAEVLMEAADVEAATVADDLGLTTAHLGVLVKNAEKRFGDALLRGNSVDEAIHSTFVHGLMLGQETEHVRTDSYSREQLLQCLTGSGADAYSWLAELIGADDDEIDAAKEG